MSHARASIEVVLDPVRTIYLKKFQTELDAVSRLYGSGCASETLRRDSFGTVVRDGVLNLPSRIDLGPSGKKDDISGDFSSSEMPRFDPVDVVIDQKLELTISPFCWDNVRISFDTGNNPKRLMRLRLWYLEWLQKRRCTGTEGLKGVVHSISGPRRNGNMWEIAIDMGSAPTEALVEIFHLLASRGVSRMTLGTEMNRVD